MIHLDFLSNRFHSQFLASPVFLEDRFHFQFCNRYFPGESISLKYFISIFSWRISLTLNFLFASAFLWNRFHSQSFLKQIFCRIKFVRFFVHDAFWGISFILIFISDFSCVITFGLKSFVSRVFSRKLISLSILYANLFSVESISHSIFVQVRLLQNRFHSQFFCIRLFFFSNRFHSQFSFCIREFSREYISLSIFMLAFSSIFGFTLNCFDCFYGESISF